MKGCVVSQQTVPIQEQVIGKEFVTSTRCNENLQTKLNLMQLKIHVFLDSEYSENI